MRRCRRWRTSCRVSSFLESHGSYLGTQLSFLAENAFTHWTISTAPKGHGREAQVWRPDKRVSPSQLCPSILKRWANAGLKAVSPEGESHPHPSDCSQCSCSQTMDPFSSKHPWQGCSYPLGTTRKTIWPNSLLQLMMPMTSSHNWLSNCKNKSLRSLLAIPLPASFFLSLLNSLYLLFLCVWACGYARAMHME